MLPDRKFSIRDVQGDPSLRGIAIRYAKDYIGEFEYMVGMRERVLRNMEISDGMVRGILNCMALDPFIQAPRPPELVKTERRNSYYRPEPVRKIPFNTAKRWNMEFLISTWAKASVTHLLDPDRSRLVYYPSTQLFMYDLWPLCPARLSSDYLRAVEEPPEDRRMCVRCVAITKEQE